jgi:hypothetical protein
MSTALQKKAFFTGNSAYPSDILGIERHPIQGIGKLPLRLALLAAVPFADNQSPIARSNMTRALLGLGGEKTLDLNRMGVGFGDVVQVLGGEGKLHNMPPNTPEYLHMAARPVEDPQGQDLNLGRAVGGFSGTVSRNADSTINLKSDDPYDWHPFSEPGSNGQTVSKWQTFQTKPGGESGDKLYGGQLKLPLPVYRTLVKGMSMLRMPLSGSLGQSEETSPRWAVQGPYTGQDRSQLSLVVPERGIGEVTTPFLVKIRGKNLPWHSDAWKHQSPWTSYWDQNLGKYVVVAVAGTAAATLGYGMVKLAKLLSRKHPDKEVEPEVPEQFVPAVA